MGIAMFSAGGLLAPLQHFVAWLMPRAAPTHPAQARQLVSHTRPAFLRTPRPGVPAQCRRAPRPLRVFRVSTEPHAPATGARMALSGTMVDVCAELDRLAAIEAATR